MDDETRDQRLEAARGEFRKLFEEERRYFDVWARELRGDLRGVAESQRTLLTAIAQVREQHTREHRELLAVMTLGHSGLDHRVSGLEVRATEHEVRLRRLEDR